MSSLAQQFSAQDMSCGTPMPRYRCHKEVWALKIKTFEPHKPTIEDLQVVLDGGPEMPGGYIQPEEQRFGVIAVSTDYVRKHNPAAGGYFVVYLDGYRSFSPAKAFEEGYSLA